LLVDGRFAEFTDRPSGRFFRFRDLGSSAPRGPYVRQQQEFYNALSRIQKAEMLVRIGRVLYRVAGAHTRSHFSST